MQVWAVIRPLLCRGCTIPRCQKRLCPPCFSQALQTAPSQRVLTLNASPGTPRKRHDVTGLVRFLHATPTLNPTTRPRQIPAVCFRSSISCLQPWERSPELGPLTFSRPGLHTTRQVSQLSSVEETGRLLFSSCSCHPNFPTVSLQPSRPSRFSDAVSLLENGMETGLG